MTELEGYYKIDVCETCKNSLKLPNQPWINREVIEFTTGIGRQKESKKNGSVTYVQK